MFTIGLFDSNKDDNDLHKELEPLIDLVNPGPHVFLIVLNINKIIIEEKNSVELISDILGIYFINIILLIWLLKFL